MITDDLKDDLKIAIIDAEAAAINISIDVDKLEADEDIYHPRLQDRNSFKVVVDGVEMTINNDNCDATILELFEEVVYNRQVTKITKYLKFKYSDGVLTTEEAKHELLGLKLPSATNEFFEFKKIAQLIARDIVSEN